MMDYIVYAALGRVAIFFLQKFPLHRMLSEKIWRGFLNDLFTCDLCLGFYVFTFLAWAMQVNLLGEYIPILSEVLTGAATSLLVHLVRVGWQAEYATIYVDME